MDTITKRTLLFLIGCIGTRSLFVYIAKIISLDLLKYMGYLALLPAIGFIYIYMTDSRQTGPEVFGDKIWWNNLRPIHGLLYSLFAYNAITGKWKEFSIYAIYSLIAFTILATVIYHPLDVNNYYKSIFYYR